MLGQSLTLTVTLALALTLTVTLALALAPSPHSDPSTCTEQPSARPIRLGLPSYHPLGLPSYHLHGAAERAAHPRGTQLLELRLRE